MSHTDEALEGDITRDPDRYAAARRVTLVGAVVNLLLAVLKVVVGWIANSQALVADGVHSFSDLISDGVVLYASKHGSQEADESHPYGHGRIETLGTVVVGLLLIAAGAGIVYDAGDRLFANEAVVIPGMLALVAAVISVLANEGLTQYTLRVADRIRSELLRANAWHHRTDAVSSLVVIVGVAGAQMGFEYLDALAAVVVAMMIAKIGIELINNAVRELVDTSLDAEEVERIRDIIQSVEGVKALHLLRTRRMGANALVDVHILVNPLLSVSEGHLIGDRVRANIFQAFDHINDVTVHIDPVDDEERPVDIGLPGRNRLERRLQACCTEFRDDLEVEAITLHYLRDGIHAEVCIALDAMRDIGEAKALSRHLSACSEQVDGVVLIKTVYH